LVGEKGFSIHHPVSSRYSICASAVQLTKRFSAEVSPAYYPNYNAAPAQLLPVITNTGPQGISFFYWGLAPGWAKNKPISEKVINVRAELIPEKPVYRKTLAERRCLVPADGFYEWKKVGKKTAIPYRYTLQNKELFSIAGFWEEYDDEQGENFHTFTLITCEANDLVAITAERMPVILTREAEQAWLSPLSKGPELISLLKPYESLRMDCYTISPRINIPAANDATLIIPTPPADQFGNLTLFD
jgi:putative SOS response-associated peptidase YedK